KPCGLMDQMACAVGGFVSIDFENPKSPKISKVDFDFAKSGYRLCIVDTGGCHADLTDEYAAIPKEMKSVAAFFGKDCLRQVDKDLFYGSLGELHGKVSDRAILRAVHFFDDNQTVVDEARALRNGDIEEFKRLIIKSGNSSFMYLQNVFSKKTTDEQGLALALSISQHILEGKGAWRVHGGGFAGTIQAFVPKALLDKYIEAITAVFGESSCNVLNIRPVGGIRLV
ncbi:MAG TPA: galactokinase, partial [Ruminococcaceae bacterium]|nr:galactokinase [Oscillospiraceae bacterium]